MIAKNRLVNAGLLFLIAMLFFVFVSDDSEAATHTVDKFGGSDYSNITQAVENASAGDIIRVAARDYHDAVNANKKLTFIGGNYGSEMGNLYDCNNGDLVAKYSLDEEDLRKLTMVSGVMNLTEMLRELVVLQEFGAMVLISMALMIM